MSPTQMYTKTFKMKKKLLILPLAFAAIASFTFVGCKDDEDTTPPVVTLNGDATPVLELQTNFVDLGATAVDDEDGSIGVTVSGTIDQDLAGIYTLTYSATDAAGNTGSATRIITYENGLESSPYEGNYSCIITGGGLPPYNYTESLSISTTLNNSLEWSKFGDYANANANLNIFLGGSSQVTIPTQTIICGNPAVARTFSGSGTYTGGGGTGSVIVMNIDETVNGVTASFTYTYTKN